MMPAPTAPAAIALVVIPARFASTRFPGKPLADLLGEPLVWRVYERARAAGIGPVIVATDDERIARAVRDRGGAAEMTSPEHTSGTDRVAEVAARHPASKLVVNIQGDEPMISPQALRDLVAPLIADPTLPISTLAYASTSPAELLRPHCVKVVCNHRGDALYFSRAPIPHPGELSTDAPLPVPFLKHMGFYALRRDALLGFSTLPPSPLEELERLEQLRPLQAGLRIRVVTVAEETIGVDTPEDLERVRALWESAQARS